MPFSFSFRFSVPGITNPFASSSAGSGSTPSCQPETEDQSMSHRGLAQTQLPSPIDSSWASIPAPAYRRRPSRSPSPSDIKRSYSPAPLVRKRGWVPSSAEPSHAVMTASTSSGFLDTPAKYRDMADQVHRDDGDDGDTEEVVVVAFKCTRWHAFAACFTMFTPSCTTFKHSGRAFCLHHLPPSKRRKGITGSVISTAFGAALIGAAVGLTVYRLWRDRGKEAYEHAEPQPPPPYQEDWVDARLNQSQPQSAVQPDVQPSHMRKTRTAPAVRQRQSGSIRHRRTTTRTRVVRNIAAEPSSSVSPRLLQREPEHDVDDPVDQMDWIGDKLSRLIEEGKRALGKEVVVLSDAPEDEVDDGSGNWVDQDVVPVASTSYVSPRPVPFGSPRKRPAWSQAHSYNRAAPLSNSPRYQSTFTPKQSVHARYATDGGYTSVPVTPLPSRTGFDEAHAMTPSPSLFSRSYQDNVDNEASDSVREAMERARAAYRARRAAGTSGLGLEGQGL